MALGSAEGTVSLAESPGLRGSLNSSCQKRFPQEQNAAASDKCGRLSGPMACKGSCAFLYVLVQ